MHTPFRFVAKLASTAALLACLGQAQAAIVEPFAGGQLSASGWSQGIGADASTYLPTAAPDGSYGIALSEATWSFNTSISFGPGQTLSAWINPGPGPATPGFTNAQGGRLYVGFDAGAAGAYSFVAASDEAKLAFADNTGYAMPAFGSSTSQVWGDQWYLLTIALSTDGHSATASLFDTDGSTLLNSLSVSGLSSSATGIALYGTGAAAITSVAVVPEPESGALALVGLGMAAGAFWRRRA
jgi:hypothetical protein